MNPILNLEGRFTWMWTDKFFIETQAGNFIWSDPGYNGDNTLTKTNLTYKQYCREAGAPGFGRCKGNHIINVYCGDQVIVKEA